MEHSTVFCANCGARITASDSVCYSCGSPNENYRPVRASSTNPRRSVKKRKKNKRPLLIGLMGGGVVVIVVVIILLVTLLGGYRGALNRMMDFQNQPSASTLKKLIPDDSREYLANYSYHGNETALLTNIASDIVSDERFYFGTITMAQYSHKILLSGKLTTTELIDLLDDYEYEFTNIGMDVDKVTEAYAVLIKMEPKTYDERYATYNERDTIIKYDGGWYSLGILAMVELAID